MDLEATEPDARSFARERWTRLFWQSLPLVLGLFAFELTANSMLAIALACLKCGWEEFLSAVWLLRWDPKRTRAIACACFYAALGFIKACVTGLAMVVVLALLSQALQGGRVAGPLFHQFAAAFLTIAGGGIAFALVMALGITIALFGRIQIWVGARPIGHGGAMSGHRQVTVCMPPRPTRRRPC